MDARSPEDRPLGTVGDETVLRLSRRVVELLRQRRFSAAEALCETISSRTEPATPTLEARVLEALDHGPRLPEPKPSSVWVNVLALGYLLALTATILMVVRHGSAAARSQPAPHREATSRVAEPVAVRH